MLKPELQALLQALNVQIAAGQALLQASQHLAEAMATFRMNEAEADEAEAAIGKRIADQQVAFQNFQRTTQATEQVTRSLQRRFGLEQWDWEHVRERIMPSTRSGEKDSDELGDMFTLVSNLNAKQQALASLLQEIARMQSRAENDIRGNLRHLSDGFRLIRQGTVANRAYDSGMAGYSAASALFIDRTR